MHELQTLGVLLGSSWASGLNLYATVGLLGLAHHLQWIQLPGSLDAVSHPVVIVVALGLLAVQFVADKIPLVDSAWDSVHSVIRPVGGAVLAYLALTDAPVPAQLAASLLSGAVAMDAHAVKASARLAINTSPEPFSNIAASLVEDSLVLTLIWLIIQHPLAALVLVVLLVIASIWVLRRLWHLLGRVFRTIWRSPVKGAV
jgi:hypothetical protein